MQGKRVFSVDVTQKQVGLDLSYVRAIQPGMPFVCGTLKHLDSVGTGFLKTKRELGVQA